jgi:hypothetical protein
VQFTDRVRLRGLAISASPVSSSVRVPGRSESRRTCRSSHDDMPKLRDPKPMSSFNPSRAALLHNACTSRSWSGIRVCCGLATQGHATRRRRSLEWPHLRWLVDRGCSGRRILRGAARPFSLVRRTAAVGCGSSLGARKRKSERPQHRFYPPPPFVAGLVPGLGLHRWPPVVVSPLDPDSQKAVTRNKHHCGCRFIDQKNWSLP